MNPYALSRLQRALLHLVIAAGEPVQPGTLERSLDASRPTLNRALRDLLGAGLLQKHGDGRSTRYTATDAARVALGGAIGASADSAVGTENAGRNKPARETKVQTPANTVSDAALPGSTDPVSLGQLVWSPASVPLIESLRAPMGTRTPVGYDSGFVDGYVPNHSSLLPPPLATDLFNAGRSQDQQPAGTYAREVLEQLLIDLSWSSSHLEGNRKSLLDTKELFMLGEPLSVLDQDTLMLLNHKDAIEFMVEVIPTEGITLPAVVDIQAKLMRDLLKDSRDIGSIRRRVVNIDGSVYCPSNVPTVLEETLKSIVDKVRHIHNPIEAAFFLWVNIAYLQPFADGNKRTSRLCANMPLMLYNCAPLSFLDVHRTDYATAMLAVYEKRNVSLAVELFEFIYRRSIQKYSVLRASMAVPDPIRARYRQALNELMQLVVLLGKNLDDAFFEISVEASDQAALREIANTELDHLEQYNCARYSLARGMTQKWIDAGRPR